MALWQYYLIGQIDNVDHFGKLNGPPLLVMSVKDDVSGVGNSDAAGGRGNFVCYRLAIVLVMILR